MKVSEKAVHEILFALLESTMIRIHIKTCEECRRTYGEILEHARENVTAKM